MLSSWARMGELERSPRTLPDGSCPPTGLLLATRLGLRHCMRLRRARWLFNFSRNSVGPFIGLSVASEFIHVALGLTGNYGETISPARLFEHWDLCFCAASVMFLGCLAESSCLFLFPGRKRWKEAVPLSRSVSIFL